jgi:hypothetical protein
MDEVVKFEMEQRRRRKRERRDEQLNSFGEISQMVGDDWTGGDV